MFSPKIDPEIRKPFSGLFADCVDTEKAYAFAVECGSEAVRRHSSMMSESATGDNFGLYRYRPDVANTGNRDEQRISLAITDTFSQYLMLLSSIDEKHIIRKLISGCREQLDEAKNSQDFVVNRNIFPQPSSGRSQRGSIPVAVVEFAKDIPRDRNARKEAQLFQYICNNCSSLPDDKSPLFLGVSMVELNHSTPTFQVFGYYQDDESKFNVVPITDIVQMNNDTMAGLYYMLASFAVNLTLDALPSALIAQPLPFPKGTGGCIKLNGNRIKVFNYANFSPLRLDNGGRGGIVLDHRRTWAHSLKLLDNAKHIPVSENVDILIYKDISGDHAPHHTKCVAQCVRHLSEAHKKGILHCDIHLGNFVFNERDPTQSRIIDWDHARLIKNLGKYVPNWNHCLPERHPDAQAGKPITLEHERHSLQAVLERFKPQSDAASGSWLKVLEMAKNVNVDLDSVAEAIEDVNESLDFLESQDHVAITGSPPRELGLNAQSSLLQSFAGISIAE